MASLGATGADGAEAASVSDRAWAVSGSDPFGSAPLALEGEGAAKMPSLTFSPEVKNGCAAFHNNEMADGSGEVKGRLAKFERGSAGAAAVELDSDAMEG